MGSIDREDELLDTDFRYPVEKFIVIQKERIRAEKKKDEVEKEEKETANLTKCKVGETKGEDIYVQ